MMITTSSIVGILLALDKAIVERSNEFLVKIFQKQHQRSSAQLDKLAKDQIKAIEQTKMTTKKRKGVAPFIRVFPVSQMTDFANLVRKL
jgi:exocyst complex component 1